MSNPISPYTRLQVKGQSSARVYVDAIFDVTAKPANGSYLTLVWREGGIQGWDDVPALVREFHKSEAADGGFFSNVAVRSNRVVDVRGITLGVHSATRIQRQNLIDAQESREPLQLVVMTREGNDNINEWANDGYFTDEIDWDPSKAPNFRTWGVQMTFPSAYKWRSVNGGPAVRTL